MPEVDINVDCVHNRMLKKEKRGLENRLTKLRWRFLRHGGSHDYWLKKNHKNRGEKSAERVDLMELEGKVFKEGEWWLNEVPSLNLMTQGKTKQNALEMIVRRVYRFDRSILRR
ncbi:MAG: hypothetical protein K940chlam2_00501 [Chlamydiae bacterium]|nr:hypothetical protein [Chlamydiota bacterium]